MAIERCGGALEWQTVMKTAANNCLLSLNNEIKLTTAPPGLLSVPNYILLKIIVWGQVKSMTSAALYELIFEPSDLRS